MPDPRVAGALAWLKKHSSRAARDGMARYAIPSEHALGVRMADIQKLGKQLGRDHALALAMWKTGVYEARMLCAYIDEPERVTPAQMDAQARDFDNWAICDTLCFALWVRTPHAYGRIRKWAGHRHEFVKRAAFALLASAALKDRAAPDAEFLRGLELIEKAAQRRTQLREEGRELGAARHRRAQPRAQRGRAEAGEQARARGRTGAALDRQGCAAPVGQRSSAAAYFRQITVVCRSQVAKAAKSIAPDRMSGTFRCRPR